MRQNEDAPQCKPLEVPFADKRAFKLGHIREIERHKVKARLLQRRCNPVLSIAAKRRQAKNFTLETLLERELSPLNSGIDNDNIK